MADRFGDLVASARDILATLDPSGAFTYVSPAIQTSLGLIPTEIVGSVIWELVHPRDVVGVHASLKETFDRGGRRALEFKMLDVSGHWHHPTTTLAKITAKVRYGTTTNSRFISVIRFCAQSRSLPGK